MCIRLCFLFVIASTAKKVLRCIVVEGAIGTFVLIALRVAIGGRVMSRLLMSNE
jgi:hypothetical protein